jgi:hypothetical protein
VSGLCEHSNEPSGSIKDGECLDSLSDYHLLKDASVPCDFNVRWLFPYKIIILLCARLIMDVHNIQYSVLCTV